MKALVTILLCYSATSLLAQSQWQGTNPIYFTSGNVGIGTSTPQFNLEGVEVPYTKIAKDNGASFYNIDTEIYNSLSREEKAAANTYFLDYVSKNGDKVILNVSKDEIKDGSALQKEVQYLINQNGYTWKDNYTLEKAK